MKKMTLKVQAIFLLSCLVTSSCAGKTKIENVANASTPSAASGPAKVAPDGTFSDDELDELLAPIALYPDPLLAQMVPAATFIDQLEDANKVLGGNTDDNLIADQSWDVSVKSVAHYPQVLQMMVEKSDWTATVGQAYVNQSTDVGKSIQRLRAEARAAGNLATSSQQEVITEGQVIRIEPAQPQVIYVPQYNPEVVYVNSGPSTGTVIAASVISFGAGLAIGAWLNNDWDYYGRGVYYHGWSGGGWVGRNRTFVNINRNVYINNSFRNVNINRNIVSRNTSIYRGSLNRNATIRRERVNAGRRDNNARVGNRATAGRNDALRTNDRNRASAKTGRARNKVSSAGLSKPNAGNAAARNRPNSGSAGISRAKASAARSRPAGGGGAARSKPTRSGGRRKKG